MTEVAKRLVDSWESVCSSSAVASLAIVAVVVNVPFVLCHPDWPVVSEPLVRSLVINIVLFLAPGLPLAGLMIRRGWLPCFELLWVITLSLGVFVTVLVTLHIIGLPPSAGLMWNGTWLVTNIGLLLNMLLGNPSAWGFRGNSKGPWSFVFLFAVAYFIFFLGATRIVPVLGDQDDEVQGTAYGLVHRLKPSLLTGRNTEYMFAHPPLLHVFVAGSLLYYNLVDELVVYDSQSPNRLNLEEANRYYLQHPYLLETGLRIFSSLH
jgi:hypothetical protein